MAQPDEVRDQVYGRLRGQLEEPAEGLERAVGLPHNVAPRPGDHLGQWLASLPVCRRLDQGIWPCKQKRHYGFLAHGVDLRMLLISRLNTPINIGSLSNRYKVIRAIAAGQTRKCDRHS
ncbi:hypothetical protein [Mycobacterium szulgai]|uniref:hypothetical protein n=1 Tax=Mycobacterium szulgai TaxID=1787 RepID=UPI0021F2E313|nr:hypothetical protein [Mycobacterium szulgai]